MTRASGRTNLASLRLLCVDQDARVRFALTRGAASHHDELEVFATGSARVALRLVAKQRDDFDALLVDTELSGVSALDLVRELRHHAPRLAVVYLCRAGDTPARAAKTQHVTGDDYLLKPISLARLLFSTRKAVALRRLRAQELRQPPFLVRLYQPVRDRIDLESVAMLEEPQAEVAVGRRRVKVTTCTLRILVRLLLTPDLHVPEPELRRLLDHNPAPTEWTNLVSQTVIRLRAQLNRASPGAGKWIDGTRGKGYAFALPTRRAALGGGGK